MMLTGEMLIGFSSVRGGEGSQRAFNPATNTEIAEPVFGMGAANEVAQAAALADGIMLDAISGYRSHAYQMGIFQRKLQRGLDIGQILAVNAAPGFSEHHSGAALDIGTPGEPPVEESFEQTPAFAWLCKYAARFGFSLSYPRGNPHGIVYEPWHWCYHHALRSKIT